MKPVYRTYDPVTSASASKALPVTVTQDPAVRARMSLAVHARVRSGMRWADALAATSADFDRRWFPRP